MGKFLFLKQSTIELKDQKEVVYFVNKSLVLEKIMNVPVENIKESDTKGLFVKDVE
jgi:hypothetical protein